MTIVMMTTMTKIVKFTWRRLELVPLDHFEIGPRVYNSLFCTKLVRLWYYQEHISHMYSCLQAARPYACTMLAQGVTLMPCSHNI